MHHHDNDRHDFTTAIDANRRRSMGQSGQAIMLFALAFGLMAGVLGMVLDGGRIYYERNRVQMAADSGAIAGVQEMRRDNFQSADDDYDKKVSDDIALHGFNAENATISIENPPLTGPYATNDLFVEVTVEYQVPTTFMRIFGPSYSTVSARSVAGLERAGDPCIIVLNESVPDAFKSNGSINIEANCGIMVNSNAPAYAARNTGSGCISSTWFGVTGGWSGGCIAPAPRSGITRILDPLMNMPQPARPDNAPAPESSTTPSGENLKIFSPGRYQNQLKVTNGDENALFLPGLYYLEKGMHVTGGNLYGAGVLFYNNDTTGNRAIDISTQNTNTIDLSAPTDGPYKGMLFWYNRNANYTNNGSRIARGDDAASFYQGAFYFPSVHLDWAGNPQSSLHWTMVIANTLNVSGNSSVIVDVNKPTKEQAPPSFAAVMFE